MSANVRQGYHSEQVRDESFDRTLNEPDYLNEQCKKIMDCFALRDGWTMQELCRQTGIEVHLVSARLNELRAWDYIITDGESRKNPLTGRRNTV